MALAAVWVLPIAFAITSFSARIQEYFQSRLIKADVALEEGVQECIESLQDLKANNAEENYLKGLGKKIDDVEKRHIIAELGVAIFVASRLYVPLEGALQNLAAVISTKTNINRMIGENGCELSGG